MPLVISSGGEAALRALIGMKGELLKLQIRDQSGTAIEGLRITDASSQSPIMGDPVVNRFALIAHIFPALARPDSTVAHLKYDVRTAVWFNGGSLDSSQTTFAQFGHW